ncbi:MAG: hypothetical protein CYG60_15580 [Actinobacteria bacterium]|nr:MAG: hypothetical protein CYG60_15580 [Actinomycetota bacterium]
MPTTSRAPKARRRVRLNLNLHPGQKEVWGSGARFRVVACGRQWGKSRLGSAVAFARALEGQSVWWVAPDYPIATIGWKLLKGLARQVPGVEVRESERLLAFASGGWLQVKSAHSEGSLRGVTLDFLVVDEAAFVAADRWISELRPTLAVKNGGALFISTFDGENWFYDLYQRGQDPEQPEWASWRKISSENPYFSAEELEEARRTTPKAEFEQEYMANPLSYVGAVFPGEKLQGASERKAGWREDASTFAGLDWGYTNPTALEVCQEDSEGRVVWLLERTFHATALDERCATIVRICKERNVEAIYSDAAGATENAALVAALKAAGLKTTLLRVPFGKYKSVGIQARRWYLENDLESIDAKACPELTRDSKRYRYKEGSTEDVVKEHDHSVDAATAFYATRAKRMVRGAA